MGNNEKPGEIQKREHDFTTLHKKVDAYGWSGSVAVQFHVDSNGDLQVSLTNATIEKTNGAAAGTLGILGGGKYEASPSALADGNFGLFLLDINRLLMTSNQGNVANDAADAGNPVKIGGKASTAVPTAVTLNDRVNAWFDLNGRQVVRQDHQTRSDTYTATGNGTTVDVSTNPLKNFSIQVKSTGTTATAWDMRLEGSLDGTNFSQIIAHTNADTDGFVKFASNSPILYFRSRCAGITLGLATNIVVTILGTN